MKLWPSLADFATDVRVKENTARGWAARNSIPQEYWADLILAAERRGIRGITCDRLLSLAPGRRDQKPSEAQAATQ